MKRTARNEIYKNVVKYNGVCHAGTISQDTGYTIQTVKKHIKNFMKEGKIENIPCPSSGKDCYYIVIRNYVINDNLDATE
jgi:predicted transcriptional regulator